MLLPQGKREEVQNGEIQLCLNDTLYGIKTEQMNVVRTEANMEIDQNNDNFSNGEGLQVDNITGDTILHDLERYNMELFRDDLESKAKGIHDDVLCCKVANLIIEYRKHHALNLSLEHLNLIKNATVSQMQDVLLNVSLKDIEKYSLLEFFDWLHFDFDSIAMDILSTLTERELFIVENREKRTLGEIGKCLNITRERVRQIEARVERRLTTNKQYTLRELMSIISIIANKHAMSFHELIEICGEPLGKILWNLYIIRKKDEFFGYIYDKSLNMIVLSSKKKSHTGDSLLTRIKALSPIIESVEMENLVCEIAREEDVPKEVVWKGVNDIYKHCSTVYYSDKITKKEAVSFVLYKYFKDGYKIADKKSYINFRTKLEELFGFKFNTQHALDTIVSKTAILSNRGMYVHPSYISYNKQLMDEIVEYINENPRIVIMYMELYDEFYQKLIDNNVNNKDMLHGILKLHCAKITNVGFTLHRDYISKEENTNFVSEFTHFVKENGPVTKKEMQEYFVGLKPINIELLLSECKEIVNMHNKYFVHSSTLEITDDDYTQLKAYLLQKCKYVPKTAEDLYYDVYYKFNEFVNQNAINSPEKLYGVFEYMFKNDESGLKFKKETVYVK